MTLFDQIKTEVVKAQKEHNVALLGILRLMISELKYKEIDTGGNLTDEIVVGVLQKEAKKRGLPILKSTVEAVEVLTDAKAVEFLTSTNVLTKEEIHSRYHVAVERYNKVVEIELHTLSELVMGHVVPALEIQITRSGGALEAMMGRSKDAQTKRVEELEKTLGDCLNQVNQLSSIIAKVAETGDEQKKMKILAGEGLTAAGKLREAADLAEKLVADELWKLPKYREMLFANML